MSPALEPIAFVDVETTGGHAAQHRVTEIAVVGMVQGEIEWQWSSLVNPQVRIPSGIEHLTGITQAMVADAPSFAELAPQLAERLQGRRFIAHNARFDYGFVRNEMRRAGRDFFAPVTCTVRLSRELFPDAGRHSLDALIERHGLHCDRRHRALPDAMVLADLWQQWLYKVDREAFSAAIERVSRRPSLPPQLPPELVDDLPESAGVYCFFGKDAADQDVLLYVGKAVNLRERVLSHFGTALRDGKSQRLATQVTRIAWHETAGELGALLREARWVKDRQPVYNRKLRGGGERWSWWLPEPTSPPQLLALTGRWPTTGDLFGLYRSAREAHRALQTLADEARLCRKLLGLEKAGDGSCFAYQLDRCSGACVGKEPPTRHALRTALALARQKLRRWPWSGAVTVEERSTLGLHEWHVLNEWRYLGSLRVQHEDGAEPTLAPVVDDPEWADTATGDTKTDDTEFDTDIYRILTRALSRPGLKVRPWPPPNRFVPPTMDTANHD